MSRAKGLKFWWILVLFASQNAMPFIICYASYFLYFLSSCLTQGRGVVWTGFVWLDMKNTVSEYSPLGWWWKLGWVISLFSYWAIGALEMRYWALLNSSLFLSILIMKCFYFRSKIKAQGNEPLESPSQSSFFFFLSTLQSLCIWCLRKIWQVDAAVKQSQDHHGEGHAITL